MEHNWLILFRRADCSDWVLKINAEFRTGAGVNLQTPGEHKDHTKYTPTQPSPTQPSPVQPSPVQPTQSNPIHSISIIEFHF